MADGETASLNFYYAKFIAILIVASGHYFEGSLLWIPATISLFIFGFSSGYFTAHGKGARNLGKFWRAKIRRLGPTLLIVNLFLAVLFWIEGRQGIVSWHSALSLLGLSGFLDWVGIRNASPFGSGLWFLTVLWLFYASFPLLAYLSRSVTGAWVTVCLAFVICTLGHFLASPPYALWPTVFSFVLGVFAKRIEWRPSQLSMLAMAIFFTLAMLLVNIAGYRSVNYYLLIIISVSVVGFLLSSRILFFLHGRRIGLAACVFEIYLIHTYLFYRAESLFFGYLASMVAVLLAAFFLNKLANELSYRLRSVS